MFSPSDRKLTGSILGLSLAAVATGLYLSPAGSHLPKPKVVEARSTQVQTRTVDKTVYPTATHTRTVTASHSKSAYPTKSHTSGSGGSGSGSGSGSTTTTTDEQGNAAGGGAVLPSDPGPVDTGGGFPVPKGGTTGSTPTATISCSSFKWQQDAQAEYLKNLSDPYALDGPAGPDNGDGLACGQLPTDPTRDPSTPVDAYVPPVQANKAAYVKPDDGKYFGVSQDTLPGDSRAYNGISTAAGKAPSLVEFFDTWDQPFTNDVTKVQTSWKHGALPVLTWMPESKGGFAHDQSAYSLKNIVDGNFDSYLSTYAAAIKQNNQVLGIRFAHEMNGNWYPWSANLNAPTKGIVNTPALYRAAWQHVWNIFQAAGANQDVIWIWTPIRIDTLGYTNNPQYSTMAEDYPGDQYVDWIGMSGYEYKFGYTSGYDYTFKQTLDGLKAISGKPIFIAETGATSVRPVLHRSTDTVTIDSSDAQKAGWFSQVFPAMLNDPQIVGFAYFDNDVVNVHSLSFNHANGTHQKVYFETDWRFETSPNTQAAFKQAMSDPKWKSGISTMVQ